MTEGYCSLAELCETEITDGTHQTPVYSEQGYIFLSSKDVTGGVIDWEHVKHIPENLHKELYARVKPQVDDILLAKNGTTGIAALVDRDEVFDIYVSLALIRPDKSKVIPQYLLYAINSPKTQEFFKRNLKGIGVPNLHLTHIRETPIKLHPKAVQKKIIEKLDCIDCLLKEYEEELDILETLVKSRFVEMFGNPVTNPMGWEKRKLIDVCDKITDGTHFSPESYDKGEYKYVTAKNIKEGGFDFSNITYVTEEIHREIYNRCNPVYGDVLYIKDGVTTGIAMVNTLHEEFSLLSSVALIKQQRDILNGAFLCGVLNNSNMYKMIRSMMGGAAITRLTVAKIKPFQIIIPPIALQNQFADFVALTDKSKIAIQKSIRLLELLKASLMQTYFG